MQDITSIRGSIAVSNFSSNFSKESEKIRYSDSELNEFKKIIIEKREGAKAYADALRDSLKGTFSESLDTHQTFKPYQDAPAVVGKEQTEKDLAGQELLILKLNAALVRIEQKNYGICRETGKLIPKARLVAVPHATLSIEGKEIQERVLSKQNGSRR